VTRVTASGRVLGAHERVEPFRALQMFMGTGDRPAVPRRIEPGQPGDLCILSVPPDDALRSLSCDMVVDTVIAGAIVR
ncbi:MAG: amidohydrolase, partial [Mycobacterium sp.]